VTPKERDAIEAYWSPADELDDHDRAEMDEASEEDFDRWARRYDELNGAPESEEDR
jgi:hypothetical protein